MIEYYFNHQPIRRWIALHFKKRPQKLPIRAYASTAEMVLSIVREGAGIGVVPKFILNSQSGSGLTLVRPTEKKFSDHIWMLEHKISSQRPAQQAFKDYVTKTLAKSR